MLNESLLLWEKGGPRKRWMRSGIRRVGRLATPSLIRRYAPYEDACPYGDEGKREHQGAPLPKRRATSNSASHRDSHAQVLTVGEGLAPPLLLLFILRLRTGRLATKRTVEDACPYNDG